MCGIAGIFSYHPNAPKVECQELVAIRDAQLTRGPDASGAWYSDDLRLGLAHRRLSIIDLSSNADQPMVDADGQYVIVFNGEIYNYQSLRDELIGEGVRFRTESDTEVLLKGYQFWGEGMLQKLRGMYALSIWDGPRSRLFLARDPYGIKPLYYSNDGRTIRFASQVKALLKGRLHSNLPDAAGIVGFLLMGSVPEPYTSHQAVSALGAGEYLVVDGDGVSGPVRFCSVVDVWRNADAEPQAASKEELEGIVGRALHDSVKHHMVADVPVGAFLSAGIDSGALVGMMSQLDTNPVHTVTLGFADFRGTHGDETVFAAELAELYGTHHETYWVTDDEIEQDFPRILEAMDQPSVDGVNTWLVSKVAHDKGLKVVVSGVGGDELFGGYEHFGQMPRWRASHRWLEHAPGSEQLAYWMSRGLARFGMVPAKAPAWCRYGANYAGLYLARRGLFMPWEISQLIDPDMAEEGLRKLEPPGFIATVLGQAPEGEFATIAALESAMYLRNQLLRDSDWASMAHSLELRTPLVDARLLQDLAPYLVRGNDLLKGKLGLARAPKPELPLAVSQRRKSGFTLPMTRWLDESEALGDWRSFPAMTRKNCHWSRRMACALIADKIR